MLVALRGTNQEFGRPYNRRIVLEAIRLHAPIARTEIARRVGLTIQTVSTIIRELEDLGLLVATREAPKGRGYPATSLAINPEGGFAIGVHVSPLFIEASLVDLAGQRVGSQRLDIENTEPEHIFAHIARMSADLAALRPGGRILGLGLAMPGPFGIESMSFVGPTTMQGWQKVDIRARLAEATGLPVFIEVEVSAAALGERLYGDGKHLANFYYLYLGVGLGGAMMHDGTVMHGAHGNAVEIGHIPAVAGGDPCPCGNRGCLERYLSLEAYQRRSAEVGEAAWFAEVAPLLRGAIITIENLFDPETIIFGGLAPVPLLSRLYALLGELPNSVAVRGDRRHPRVTLSREGQDAVLRGAAALVVANVLSPRFGQMFTEDKGRSGRDPLVQERAA